LHSLEPASSLSGGITPYSPSSEDSSLSFVQLQPDSNHSPFQTTFSLESASSLGSHGIPAIYARSDNDPTIVPSSAWPSNGPNIDMSQLNLPHYSSHITSPTFAAHALMGDQPPRVFQSGPSSTLEDGGQGNGINSDPIYASHLAQSAHWNIYPSGQEIFNAWDEASRCEFCVARTCWYHPRD